jgi:phosphohistidine phosphatase SixA
MKKSYLVIVLIGFVLLSCKKDKENGPSSLQITSSEYDGKLLFVNKNDFQITTNQTAIYTTDDTNITISSEGLVKRLTSGEVAAIDIAPKESPETKTRIYAFGATDKNHVKPQITYNGKGATDTYNSYLKGWATLQKLPIANETYALVLRHADADQGVDYSLNHDDEGPVNWWKSSDKSLARQLNEEGRIRSRELGINLKALGYPIARVYTSEFRRAIETAELMELGLPLGQNAALNHPSHNNESLFLGLIELLKNTPVDNKITLFVTHHPINEIINSGGYPSFPAVSPFNWTGMYLVKIAPDKTITYEGAVSWAMVKRWHDIQAGL